VPTGDHAVPGEIRHLFTTERLADVRPGEPPILASVPRVDPPATRRFDGLYGGIYNRVIQTPALRRAAFSVWGSADPLYRLEAFIGDAIREVPSGNPVLVDLPCGGGTLLPFLARTGFAGTVIEADLAIHMLRRAVALHRTLEPRPDAVFLQTDALELPLASECADAVVSINGLHVMPDAAAFLREVARITKPGGVLSLITPVNGTSLRSKAILMAANALAITPQTPPSLGKLRRMIAESGFSELRRYGGESITGIAVRRG
jgi:SAM-dependent methyltransferase